MSEPDYENNVFIFSWDMYGLEACINATEMDRAKTFAVLANQEYRGQDIGQIIEHLTLRARFNVQRHYEIYSIAVTPDISKEMLVDEFEKNPQEMANLIRERGNKIYSDRIRDNDERIKIT